MVHGASHDQGGVLGGAAAHCGRPTPPAARHPGEHHGEHGGGGAVCEVRGRGGKGRELMVVLPVR